MGLLNNAPFLQLPSPLKNVQFYQEETRNDHKGPLFAPLLTRGPQNASFLGPNRRARAKVAPYETSQARRGVPGSW